MSDRDDRIDGLLDARNVAQKMIDAVEANESVTLEPDELKVFLDTVNEMAVDAHIGQAMRVLIIEVAIEDGSEADQ